MGQIAMKICLEYFDNPCANLNLLMIMEHPRVLQINQESQKARLLSREEHHIMNLLSRRSF